MNTTWETHKFEHYIFSLLLAVEVIMSFTFLGYVHIPPISITTAYIPIIITACLFGPAEASLAGLLFGLGSLYKASATYVMPADAVFSPFRSDFPIGSILLSVGTRVLFGFLLGCLFQLTRKSKRKNLCKLLITIAAPKLHALLVYTAMGLFFPSLGFNFSSIFMLEKSDLIILLFCVAVVLAIDKLYHSSFIQTYKNAVNEYENTPYWSPKIGFVLGGVSTFIFCMAVLSTVYFSNRMYYMLGQHGVDVTQHIHRDILHLQVQFLTAMLALNFILLILILMVYRYMKFREYTGELDFLTGIMGRKLFLHTCLRSQKSHAGAAGWFLVCDLDYFKHINDKYGHSVGDEVLKQFAEHLQNTFRFCGSVGRIGGDEFAVMLDIDLSQDQLEHLLTQFLRDISGILEQVTVSCSIGAYRFVFPQEIKHLLTETDRVLYQAKENGRACFVIEDSTEK